MDSLTIADRGDCCPAQARALVGKDDMRLLFCYHHYNLYAPTLFGQGWEVVIEDFSGLETKTGAEVR